MDLKSLLHRFDGRSRMLVHALHSGASGSSTAQKVFNKQRISDPDLTLTPFLEILCQQEVCVHEDTIVSKPLVCLFSEVFKRNLLDFLHLIHPVLPRDNILHLLQCLTQDQGENQWSNALIKQLYRDVEGYRKGTLLTSKCTEKVKGLCERFKDKDAKGRWTTCFQELETEQTDFSVLTQKKRKSDNIDCDAQDEQDVQHSKRVKTDFCTNKEEETLTEEKEESESRPTSQLDLSASKSQTSSHQLESSKVLPDNIKAVVPVIKKLLDTESAWDKSSDSALKILHECDPDEVEALCSVLSLSEAPEQSLPQFCSSLLELSPDLSHSTATAVITNLLLNKILSLVEPASRCLVTAVMSLCTRYPRPTCQAVIEPVLQKDQIGSAQAELLCRLVEDCLEPHHRLLVFRTTLEVSWDEGVLSVIHALLDSKLELNEKDFSLFTDQLCNQSSLFSKSMKFAKMMLSVLTKYQSHVNTTYHHTLSSCLSFNETFLKKSLLAALKRISL